MMAEQAPRRDDLRTSSSGDDSDDHDMIATSFSLEVVQQPLRARMCGFGDKDRRNVTPAPVLKLIAKDRLGRIVPTSRLNRNSFIVNADLWLEDEVTERNLVLISPSPTSHAAAAMPTSTLAPQLAPQPPSASPPLGSTAAGVVSASHNTSGPNASNRESRSQVSSPLTATRDEGSYSIRKQSDSSATNQNHRSRESEERRETSAASYLAEKSQSQQRNYRQPEEQPSGKGQYQHQHQHQYDQDEQLEVDNGLYLYPPNATRNLVGLTALNGQIAPDLDNKLQIWFSFAMLSIRTEGVFKIKFSLADLSPSGMPCPILTHCFSDPIQVQTPKKFQGTCDNNAIAAHLNQHGIKIPVRKDEKKNNNLNHSSAAAGATSSSVSSNIAGQPQEQQQVRNQAGPRHSSTKPGSATGGMASR